MAQSCTGSESHFTNKLSPVSTAYMYLCRFLEWCRIRRVELSSCVSKGVGLKKQAHKQNHNNYSADNSIFFRLSYVLLELMSQTAPCFIWTNMIIKEGGGHSMRMHWTSISMVPWLHWQLITGTYYNFKYG